MNIPKLNEDTIKGRIRDILINQKGWKWEKNLYSEQFSPSNKRKCDLVCYNKNFKPLIVIEIKNQGKNLKKAGEQAIEWALECQVPIAYATDGNIIKTWHLGTKTKKKILKKLQEKQIIVNDKLDENFNWGHFNKKEKETIKKYFLEDNNYLKLNNQEVGEFLDEETALKYVEEDEYNNINTKIIISRKELINLFSSINDDLRKSGLQAGIERFGELCNILFLKLFSEKQELENMITIKKTCLWNYFKDKSSEELLDHINNTVLKEFRKMYGEEIFPFLQIQDSIILERIINKLSNLYLSNISSDTLGDTFEYFLKIYLTNQKKDLGEYFTPRHLVKFLVELANPRFGEKIYDPFCGTGGILIESFKHIKKWILFNEKNNKTLKKETLYGHEIVKNLCRVTKMNMILSGDGQSNINNLDSWANPIDAKYDVVITNIPFGLGSLKERNQINYCQKHYFLQKKVKKDLLFQKEQIINCLECQKLIQNKKDNQKKIDKKYKNYYLNNLNADSLCIEHCFKAINSNQSNSRIIMIIPKGILFSFKFTNLRKFIYDNSYIKYIIDLPYFAFKPYAEPRAVILCLTNIWQKKEQKEVWYFEVKNDGYTVNIKREKKEGQNDFDVFFNFKDSDEKTKLKNGFKKLEMEKIKKNNWITIPNVYQEFIFNNSHELISLGDLIEEISEKNNINATVWSITNNRGFVPSEEYFKERVYSEDTKNYKLVFPNYFAYSSARINIGSINFNSSQKIGCVSPAIGIVFKVKDLSKIIPEYLFYLFKSEKFKEQVNNYAFGTVRQTLSWKNFCLIKLSIQTLEKQKEIIKNINKIKEDIQNSQKKINNYQKKILDFLDNED